MLSGMFPLAGTVSRSVGHAWPHHLGTGVDPADPTPFEVVHYFLAHAPRS